MTLHELNTLDKRELREKLLDCCGSGSWVEKMLPVFPVDDLVELLEDAEEKWFECSEEDWKEAFSRHPEIGDPFSLQKGFGSAAGWESEEQSSVYSASRQTVEALANGNRLYREKFGYIFIVCASGKSAEEMLGMLYSRLPNEPAEEIRIAADEQNKITKLRLQKLVED